jgi:hypothetical protein
MYFRVDSIISLIHVRYFAGNPRSSDISAPPVPSIFAHTGQRLMGRHDDGDDHCPDLDDLDEGAVRS